LRQHGILVPFENYLRDLHCQFIYRPEAFFFIDGILFFFLSINGNVTAFDTKYLPVDVLSNTISAIHSINGVH